MDQKLRQQLIITKQKIIVTFIMFFMFSMVFTSFEMNKVQAATDVNTEVYQNIVAGSLYVDAMASLSFADVTAGTTQNTEANMTVLNIGDGRGTSAGWTTSAYSTNFTNAGGSLILPNSRLYIDPNEFWAVNGASNTGISLGSGGTLDSLQTIITASSGNGAGDYNVANTLLNMSILVGDSAGDYNATVTFTIS